MLLTVLEYSKMIMNTPEGWKMTLESSRGLKIFFFYFLFWNFKAFELELRSVLTNADVR